ncbi:MAG: hypothetical protein Aurels2KO_05610 [Aureliella sp.]
MQLLGLLRIEEVREEIDLDDDTYEAMNSAVRDAMPDFRKMREMSEDERAEAGKKAETAMKDVMDEVLAPKQQDRLLGLIIQQYGYAAAANKLIAEKISLDDDGIKEVAEAAASSQTKLFEKMRESFGQGGGERPDRSKVMADMREASDEAVTEVLSKAQVKQLDELKGEKFEFPERQFGGRGGQGGQGRGGAGGRPGEGGRGGAGGRPGQGGGEGGRGGRGGRPGQGVDAN